MSNRTHFCTSLAQSPRQEIVKGMGKDGTRGVKCNILCQFAANLNRT